MTSLYKYYAPSFILVEHSVCYKPVLCHWPSIAGMLPQSNCGDEEDGRIGLSLWHHYVSITLLALCLLSTLCVMNQFLF